MTRFLCAACGTQHPEAEAPPGRCPVCEDERQFVPPGRQSWTTLDKLRVGHSNAWRTLAPDLFAAQTHPASPPASARSWSARRRAACSIDDERSGRC